MIRIRTNHLSHWVSGTRAYLHAYFPSGPAAVAALFTGTA